MKGRIVPIAACFTVLLLSAALAACQPEHRHTFSEEWAFDATHHWHEATCEHGEETEGKAEHMWDGGVVTTAATCESEGTITHTCAVCSATKTEPIASVGHVWDDGEVTVPVSCLLDGITTYTCTVCDATKQQTIPATGHTYAEGWTTTTTHHWHAATCEHSDEQEGYGEHTYDENKVCTVCNMKYVSVGLEYTMSANGPHWAVSGIGTCTDTEIYIPATYNGLPVKEIGENAFYENTTITGVVLPDSITTIGHEAFHNCSSLTSVTIGNGVTSIGDNAFRNCSSMTSVTIPDSVTSIGSAAFYGCSSLTSVIIPNSVTSIGRLAFNGCSGLISVTIGSGVTSIGMWAFRDCSSLTSVTFENPNGWRYSSSSSATGGTSISSSSLANASTAATFLTKTYRDYYWRRG